MTWGGCNRGSDRPEVPILAVAARLLDEAAGRTDHPFALAEPETRGGTRVDLREAGFLASGISRPPNGPQHEAIGSTTISYVRSPFSRARPRILLLWARTVTS